MSRPFELIEEYMQLVAAFSSDRAAFERLLHADFLQIEYPNTLNRQGQQSDRNQIFDRLQSARQMLTSQKFEVTNLCADERQVFVEAIWTGQMAADAGPLKRGQSLKASFCMAFEFRDGQILRQRNYDCFDPFD